MKTYISNFILRNNSFEVSATNEVKALPELFNFLNKKRSFPPDGVLINSEIEHYLDIRFENKLVGFYKITDLHFEQTIELHGSFAKTDTFLIRGYFELTKLFILKVSNDWPQFAIKSMVNKSHYKVQNFLQFLNFTIEGIEGNYIIYRLISS